MRQPLTEFPRKRLAGIEASRLHLVVEEYYRQFPALSHLRPLGARQRRPCARDRRAHRARGPADVGDLPAYAPRARSQFPCLRPGRRDGTHPGVCERHERGDPRARAAGAGGDCAALSDGFQVIMRQDTAPGTPLRELVRSIDEIEHLTRIDFFPALPDDLENDLEASLATSDEWRLDTPLDTSFAGSPDRRASCRRYSASTMTPVRWISRRNQPWRI